MNIADRWSDTTHRWRNFSRSHPELVLALSSILLYGLCFEAIQVLFWSISIYLILPEHPNFHRLSDLTATSGLNVAGLASAMTLFFLKDRIRLWLSTLRRSDLKACVREGATRGFLVSAALVGIFL